MSDNNVTRIHPAPSVANPFRYNPWAGLSVAEVNEAISRAEVRIEAAIHTKQSLERELARRRALGGEA